MTFYFLTLISYSVIPAKNKQPKQTSRQAHINKYAVPISSQETKIAAKLFIPKKPDKIILLSAVGIYK